MNVLLIIPALYLLSSLTATLRWLYTIPFVGAFLIAGWMLNSPTDHSVAISWFQSGEFEFRIALSADARTAAVITFATLVAALVAIYSTWYFKDDPGATRFRITLSFFMTAMYGLLSSANLMLTFFCWELVGLSSYLLIGFYRVNKDAGPAATKAMLMNKIGDAGFLVALMAIGSQTVNFNLGDLSQAASGFHEGAALIAGVGLLFAVMAKSAQVPLHTWLPDAMAGPAPVSALIHSATMVASGVFLLVRWDFLFPEVIKSIAGGVGLVTMLIAGWNALSQTGLKRLLAWSTISQLGLMVMAAGYGNGGSALLHLITHGFFKAGLFLLAGILLMHAHHSSETAETHELEMLSGNNSLNKWLSGCLVILSAGSAGLPLTGSFISKEAMVATLPNHAVVAFFISSLLTIAYTGRLLWYLK
ncbi:MAG: NADH-quinone oxidoreductase subunit L, partial [Bacteroidota bacterium]